ncbi:MAG: hypothetical protein AABY00_04060 [Nanoarchaeota archaeon]
MNSFLRKMQSACQRLDIIYDAFVNDVATGHLLKYTLWEGMTYTLADLEKNRCTFPQRISEGMLEVEVEQGRLRRYRAEPLFQDGQLIGARVLVDISFF